MPINRVEIMERGYQLQHIIKISENKKQVQSAMRKLKRIVKYENNQKQKIEEVELTNESCDEYQCQNCEQYTAYKTFELIVNKTGEYVKVDRYCCSSCGYGNQFIFG